MKKYSNHQLGMRKSSEIEKKLWRAVTPLFLIGKKQKKEYYLNLASSLRHGVTTHSGLSWRGNCRIPDDYVGFFEKGGFLSVPIFEYLEGRFVV
ncbi:MAG: hypothetical protein [Olavius algarvensis Gamma 1 endosymbiont]|nr:MAG: hypothetical protein [Olavius algarvensis Gamma 1 endosymbiont]